jgi:hypothetical protein
MAGRVTPSGVMYDSGLPGAPGPRRIVMTTQRPTSPAGWTAPASCAQFLCHRVGWAVGHQPLYRHERLRGGGQGQPRRLVRVLVRQRTGPCPQQRRLDGGGGHGAGQQLRPGDCILRSGSGPNGHIAFIHAVLDKGKKYELLHTNKTGTPVHTEAYDFQFLLNSYTHLLRAQPIKLVKPDTPPPPPSNPAAQVALAGRL